MTKGGKSDAVSGAGKEKATAEKKRKRSSHRTKFNMDFDPKTTMLHSQGKVNEHLAKYGIGLSPGIKVEFCSQDTEFGLSPPNGGVYMHPQVLARG